MVVVCCWCCNFLIFGLWTIIICFRIYWWFLFSCLLKTYTSVSKLVCAGLRICICFHGENPFKRLQLFVEYVHGGFRPQNDDRIVRSQTCCAREDSMGWKGKDNLHNTNTRGSLPSSTLICGLRDMKIPTTHHPRFKKGDSPRRWKGEGEKTGHGGICDVSRLWPILGFKHGMLGFWPIESCARRNIGGNATLSRVLRYDSGIGDGVSGDLSARGVRFGVLVAPVGSPYYRVCVCIDRPSGSR